MKLAACGALLLLHCGIASARDDEAKQPHYTIRVVNAAQHKLHISFASFSEGQQAEYILSPLPEGCGTREVSAVRVTNEAGKQVPVKELRRERWEADAPGSLTFEYDLVIDAPCESGSTVESAGIWFRSDRSLVYRSLSDGITTVTLTGLPTDWNLYTTLPHLQTIANDSGLYELRAADYKQLADSPLFMSGSASQVFLTEWNVLVVATDGLDATTLAKSIAEILREQRAGTSSMMIIFRKGQQFAAEHHHATAVFSLPARQLSQRALKQLIQPELRFLCGSCVLLQKD